MATVLYANGRIPQSALDPVPAANGQTAWLLPIPAASFLQVAAECRRRYGWSPLVTSAGDGFRSYERQVTVFLQRYEVRAGVGPFGDVKTWNGVRYVRVRGASAATPGFSNHGKGITVDITGLGGYSGTRFAQLAPLLIAAGWSNAEGRRINEAWHWNCTRTAYPVIDTTRLPGVDITIPTTTGTLPTLIPEDDMPTADEVATAVVDKLLARKIVTGDAGLDATTPFGALVGDIGVHARKAAKLLDVSLTIPEGGEAPLRQVLADTRADTRGARAYLKVMEDNLRGAIATMTPDQVAALVPDELAADVVDQLLARVATLTKPNRG